MEQNMDGKYTYHLTDGMEVKSDINIKDIRTPQEAQELADGFLQKLEELCVERELYYDCSNPWYGDTADQKEKENRQKDLFVIVDKSARVALGILEKHAGEDEEVRKYITRFLKRITLAFQYLQKKYNELLDELRELAKVKNIYDTAFLRQFYEFDDLKYKYFQDVYNKEYFKEIGKIADFWKEKRQEYHVNVDEDEDEEEELDMDDDYTPEPEPELYFDLDDLV